MKKVKAIIKILGVKFLILFMCFYATDNSNVESDLTWVMDFERLHTELRNNYGFTDWKKNDWQEKYNKTYQSILVAENVNDSASYYLALRNYIISIPDTHVNFNINTTTGRDLDEQVKYDEIGGFCE